MPEIPFEGRWEIALENTGIYRISLYGYQHGSRSPYDTVLLLKDYEAFAYKGGLHEKGQTMLERIEKAKELNAIPITLVWKA